TQHQKVRDIATCSTELRTKGLSGERKPHEQLLQVVAENLKTTPDRLTREADNGSLCAVTCEGVKKQFLLVKKKTRLIRLIDRDGVIRLQKRNGTVAGCLPAKWRQVLNTLLEDHTVYGDGGAEIPNVYVALGSRIINLAGMQSHAQIVSLLQVELGGVQPDEQLIMVCTETTENERG
ncbi:MAG: hydantoinase/oxoprolinase family protein, partial [Oscillospiraceae bacterium]